MLFGGKIDEVHGAADYAGFPAVTSSVFANAVPASLLIGGLLLLICP